MLLFLAACSGFTSRESVRQREGERERMSDRRRESFFHYWPYVERDVRDEVTDVEGFSDGHSEVH